MSKPFRRVTKKAVRYEILAFVEGKVTEEQYLRHFHRLHRFEVNLSIDDFRGGPLQLVEHAVQAKKQEAKRARRGKGRPHDEIWCVFDVDDHPNFDQALSLAETHDIGVAISNPCLELWFLLHFQDQTAYIERHAAQSSSKGHLGCDKNLTHDALGKLAENFDDAKARALKLDKKHEGDGSKPRENPSSDTWRIVEVITESRLPG